MNFFKILIAIETRVDDLHFVSWAQIQKILFLRRNFRFRARSNNFSKYIAYFVTRFFYLLHNYMKTNTSLTTNSIGYSLKLNMKG